MSEVKDVSGAYSPETTGALATLLELGHYYLADQPVMPSRALSEFARDVDVYDISHQPEDIATATSAVEYYRGRGESAPPYMQRFLVDAFVMAGIAQARGVSRQALRYAVGSHIPLLFSIGIEAQNAAERGAGAGEVCRRAWDGALRYSVELEQNRHRMAAEASGE